MSDPEGTKVLHSSFWALIQGKAFEDALQYIKVYVAGVSAKTDKAVEEQVIRLQSKVWNNL